MKASLDLGDLALYFVRTLSKCLLDDKRNISLSSNKQFLKALLKFQFWNKNNALKVSLEAKLGLAMC